MPQMPLTAAFVRSAACPPGKKKVDYYDTSINGFILEVRASGGKTYHLRCRDNHGRLRQHKIGDAKALSFEQAKKAAQTLKSRVVLGENPAEERDTIRQTPTLRVFATGRYLPYVQGYKRRPDADEGLPLRLHLLPQFGHRHLDQISPKAR